MIAPDSSRSPPSPRWILRHSAGVRITHWLNAIAFIFLVWSGAAILLAFPQFHWGQAGYVGMDPALKLPLTLDTKYTTWARPMHFSFAWLLVINGAVYILLGAISGHFRRDLLPERRQLHGRYLLDDIRRHLALRHSPDDAVGYNVLQRLAYLVVIFVLLPAMLLSGLAMSPTVVSAAPWLTDLFQGRQSARFVHFIAASLLVAFLAIHLFQVVVAGASRQVFSMLTGRVPAVEVVERD